MTNTGQVGNQNISWWIKALSFIVGKIFIIVWGIKNLSTRKGIDIFFLFASIVCLESVLSGKGWIDISWPLATGSIFILLGFSIISIKLLALITSEKLTQRRLELTPKGFINCFLAFNKTVLSENSIEIVIGLAGQFLLVGLLFLWGVEKFKVYYVIYSLVFFALWATPIIKGFIRNLEVIYIKAFIDVLTRRLQQIKDHYIIIGYGRFGKTVINDLFENYIELEAESEDVVLYGRYKVIKWHKHFHDLIKAEKHPNNNTSKKEEKGDNETEKHPTLLLERILNEGFDDILLCTNLVIVDKDERLFSNVFSHPNLGKIGVVVLDRLNRLRYNKENYKKKIYIPAIVGESKNISTLDLARVDRSKMVLSLVPDEEATYRIFEAICKKQKERKGIIAGSTTGQEHLLIPQSYDTKVSFLHGHRVRGWELGDIVAGNLIDKRDDSGKIRDVKILILGCGRQLHFLLEKMWLEIICEKGKTNNEKKFFKEFLRNNCLIIGDDKYINNSTITDKNGYRYWNHELAYVTNKEVYADKRKNYRMSVPYLRGISDEPTLLGPIIFGTVDAKQEPFTRVNPKFFDKKPEIVIISSDSPEEILKAFNELSSISKKYNLDPKPVIIAESNPDVQKVVMELNKAYNANNNSTKYPISLLNKPDPIEFSENVVNSFKDGDKMVRGYMEAMTREKGVIFRACVEDIPGVFVKLCFLLANLKIDNPNISEDSHVPSFHNTQALTQRNGYFCFFSDSDLINMTGKECKKMADFKFDKANHIREVFVSSNNPQDKEWLINGKENPKVEPLIPKDTDENIRGCCMGLTFCPVCSFHESVKAESNQLTKSDKEKARWKNDKDPEYKLNNVEENKRYEKFARIYACCKGGDDAGSLALLLYKFMPFEGNGSDIDFKAISLGQLVFNVKYIMNVECYNPRFELLKIYGNLEKCDGNKNKLQKLYSECLQGIVISPVGHEDNWQEYSKKLMKKVSDSSFYDDGKEEKPPDNILIITNDYRDILLNEYIQFEVGKNVDDAFIQGDIDKPSPEELKFELYNEFKSKKMKPALKNILKTFTTTTLSNAIKDYVKARANKNKLKEWDDWVDANFEDFKDFENYQGCPCPITDCPFKSKALYLLIEGKERKKSSSAQSSTVS